METGELDQITLDGGFRPLGRVLSLPEGSSSYDNPPARALAVSNRFGLTFFATPKGFSLVKTKDLVQLSNTSGKEELNIAEKCMCNIELLDVRILELSGDEAMLAVCTTSEIQFFYVWSLVHETDKKPFEVRSPGAPLKDFHWCTSEASKYIILSNDGSLSVGTIRKEPLPVCDNASAACWSWDGKYIAYAVQLSLNIVTADLVKLRVIDLPPKLPGMESESADIQVDALRWILPESVLVSYVQREDGEEIAYPLFLLQAIEAILSEDGAKCTALSVFRAFVGFTSIIPNSTGPYLLSQYLEPWKLVLASCRKEVDEHLVVLGWSTEGRAVFYEVDEDVKYVVPFGADFAQNAVTGLAVDRTSCIRLPDPRAEDGEAQLPPCPMVLCTTLDNKLCIFGLIRYDFEEQLVLSICDLDEVKPESCLQVSASKPSATSDGLPLLDQRKITEFRNEQRQKVPEISAAVQLSRPPTADNTLPKQQKNLDNQQSILPRAESVQKYQTTKSSQNIIRSASLGRSQPLTSSENRTGTGRSGLSDMEADFAAELHKVRKMEKEVDEFMFLIQGNEVQKAAFTKSIVEKLEHDISTVSRKCNLLKHDLHEHSQLVEELRDQSVQVDAWRIYVQSLVEQAADSRYQDLWVRQRLHPEMDIKRKHVMNADLALKRHIAELETHLHVLELNQRQLGYKKQSTKQQTSHLGQFQSLHCLYNTVNAQFEAAEQLSSRLSQLMEQMNVPLGAISRKNASSMENKGGESKNKNQSVHQILSTPLKPVLLDIPAAGSASRRRRDSMDNVWADLGTTKTTIRRVTRVKPAAAKKELRKLNLSCTGPSSSALEPFLKPEETSRNVEASKPVSSTTGPGWSASPQISFGGNLSWGSKASTERTGTDTQPSSKSNPLPAAKTNPFENFSIPSQQPKDSSWTHLSVAATDTTGSDFRLKPETSTDTQVSFAPAKATSFSAARQSAASSGLKAGLTSSSSDNTSAAEPAKPSFSFAIQSATSHADTFSSQLSDSSSFAASLSSSSPSNTEASNPRLSASTSTLFTAGLSNSLPLAPSSSLPSAARTSSQSASTTSLPASSTSSPLASSASSPLASSTSLPSASSTSSPALSTSSPALGTSMPALSSSLPALSTSMPALSTYVPALSTSVPALSTSSPALSTSSPAFITSSPPASTPALSTSSPVLNTPSQAFPPAFSSSSPALITSLPASATPSPAISISGLSALSPASSTTTALSTSSPALRITTASPAVGSSSPAVSTSSPAVSTSSPAVSTSSPAVTSPLGVNTSSSEPTFSFAGQATQPPNPFFAASSAAQRATSNGFSPGLLGSPSPVVAPQDTQAVKPNPPAANSSFATNAFATGFQTSSTGLPAQSSSSATPPASSPFSFATSSSLFPDLNQSQKQQNEDDMEEEAPAATPSFAGFGGLGLGGKAPSKPVSNPFGVSPSRQSSTLSAPEGQLFRPPAFSLPTAQQATTPSSGPAALSGGFGSATPGGGFGSITAASGGGFGTSSPTAAGGFGQPSQVGAGQQALGSALGAFGQTRQMGFGSGAGSNFASSATGSAFGTFSSASAGGGGFGAFSQKQVTGGGFAGFAASSQASSGPRPSSVFTEMRK